jgi:hypothetical protein
MFQKTPTIKFYTANTIFDSIPHPDKASAYLPNWFRKMPKEKGPIDRTVKTCIPFMESMTDGFVIPLWADYTVVVERNEHGNLFAGLFMGRNREQNEDHNWAQLGDEAVLNIDAPMKSILKFDSPWHIETPKGYSVQIKTPANGFHSNIYLFEGTVDTDTFNMPILFPFIWLGKKEGTFLIPRGTPIAQVKMFKREKQNIICEEISKKQTKKYQKQDFLLQSLFKDRYKRFFWNKTIGKNK